MSDLAAAVAAELARPAPAFAQAFAEHLAGREPKAAAILFYGSILRTGDRDGVLDYYVLTDAEPVRLASRMLWPDVSYIEWADAAGPLRAKVATMSLAQFAKAAVGDDVDTTIWTRFVQPSALVWSRDEAAAQAVRVAVADASRTAAAFAAVLGPAKAPRLEYWKSLFRQTYRAEFRIEPGGREAAILAVDPARYEARLTQAWDADGLTWGEDDGAVAPHIPAPRRKALMAAWSKRRAWGRPLNIIRLAKATFTFEGAARYAAWKIERHTGVALPLTPWHERHPLLSAPGMAWWFWRERRRHRSSLP